MITEPLHAFVLHRTAHGETSLRVVFFTREEGLVHAFYKGARTPKKKALLQAFSPLWLVLSGAPHHYFVHGVECASSSIPLVGSALIAGLYLNELLYHTLQSGESHALLYDAYVTALDGLVAALDRYQLEAVLRRFEWSLLQVSGYAMSLVTDALTNQPIIPTQYYQFQSTDGFRPADEGILGAHILAFSRDELIDPCVLKSVKFIMRRAIHTLLDGKPLKTRSFYLSETCT